MKKARRNTFAAVLAVSLALLTLAPAYSVAGDNKPVISKKELKVLLKTAKEPADHQKIAEYYRQKAQQLRAGAKEHVEMAEEYTKNPTFAQMEIKQRAWLGQGTSHCRRWAELDEQEAKEAEALATLHEDMAKAAEQKQ